MATYQRTRTDYAGTHVETVTEYFATYCDRTVIVTAASRDDAQRQAAERFACLFSALSLTVK